MWLYQQASTANGNWTTKVPLMVRVRKMCHCSFHLNFPLAQISFEEGKETGKSPPLCQELCMWTQPKCCECFPRSDKVSTTWLGQQISFTSNTKFIELKEFKLVMCLNGTMYISALSLWGLVLIHAMKSNVKLFYLFRKQNVFMLVCWTHLLGGCYSKAGRDLI